MAFRTRKISTLERTPENTSALIRSLDFECFPDDLPIATQNIVWWVVYETSFHKWMPAAFAGLEYAGYEDRGYLCRAGVLPDFQGYGLQRHLIRVREREARKIGWSRLVTYASYDNTISANNLIRCGYRLYEPEYQWGTRGAYYFYKDL